MRAYVAPTPTLAGLGKLPDFDHPVRAGENGPTSEQASGSFETLQGYVGRVRAAALAGENSLPQLSAAADVPLSELLGWVGLRCAGGTEALKPQQLTVSVLFQTFRLEACTGPADALWPQLRSPEGHPTDVEVIARGVLCCLLKGGFGTLMDWKREVGTDTSTLRKWLEGFVASGAPPTPRRNRAQIAGKLEATVHRGGFPRLGKCGLRENWDLQLAHTPEAGGEAGSLSPEFQGRVCEARLAALQPLISSHGKLQSVRSRAEALGIPEERLWGWLRRFEPAGAGALRTQDYGQKAVHELARLEAALNRVDPDKDAESPRLPVADFIAQTRERLILFAERQGPCAMSHHYLLRLDCNQELLHRWTEIYRSGGRGALKPLKVNERETERAHRLSEQLKEFEDLPPIQRRFTAARAAVARAARATVDERSAASEWRVSVADLRSWMAGDELEPADIRGPHVQWLLHVEAKLARETETAAASAQSTAAAHP